MVYITASLLIDGLSGGLYKDEGQCLMELVRNGLNACMVGSNSWHPERGKIEIKLVKSHPLSPHNGPALIVLDRGSGMTETGLRNFCGVGASMEYLREKNISRATGSAQKNMGRLAALALNVHCLRGEDYFEKIKHGYHVLTRTAPNGEVRYIPVIPEDVERMQRFDLNRFISPADTQMGPLKNIPGSFTAIVIPTPVFRNEAHIYEALKWHLPRERNKMFQLRVGEEEVQPPALESTVIVSSRDGEFKAYLGKGDVSSGGIWLCDSKTGFRVADCRDMMHQLPEPLWFIDLVGDIFAPGLLAHQNSARSALHSQFTRRSNPEWKRIYAFLFGTVAPAARGLLEREPIEGEVAEVTNKILQSLKDCYGDPDAEEEERKQEEKIHPRPKKPRSSEGEEGEEDEEKEEEKEKRPNIRRVYPFRVGSREYRLYRTTLPDNLYCQKSPSGGSIIMVNDLNYKGLPKGAAAQWEHCMTRLLETVFDIETPGNLVKASQFATEIQREMRPRK